MNRRSDTSAVTAPERLASLVVDWWRRHGEHRLWRGARRVVAAVCWCVCHLPHTTSDIRPTCRVAPVVAAPAVGTHRGSIVLRHAIVLRAPPAFA